MLYQVNTPPSISDVRHALREAERRNVTEGEIENIVFAMGPSAHKRENALILDKILIGKFSDEELAKVKGLIPPHWN